MLEKPGFYRLNNEQATNYYADQYYSSVKGEIRWHRCPPAHVLVAACHLQQTSVSAPIAGQPSMLSLATLSAPLLAAEKSFQARLLCLCQTPRWRNRLNFGVASRRRQFLAHHRFHKRPRRFPAHHRFRSRYTPLRFLLVSQRHWLPCTVRSRCKASPRFHSRHRAVRSRDTRRKRRRSMLRPRRHMYTRRRCLGQSPTRFQGHHPCTLQVLWLRVLRVVLVCVYC